MDFNWIEIAKGAGLGVLIFFAVIGLILGAAVLVIRKIAQHEDRTDLE